MTIKNLNLTIRWLFSTDHEEFWTSLLSEIFIGRPERGEASIPNLNDLPTIVYEEYEEHITISDNIVIEVKLEQNELASRINNLPKKELQSMIKKDSILKPLNAFSAEQQELLRELTIKHFSLKNQIIHKIKNLYPNDAWEFTQFVRETFFEGRSREYSLEYLQKMLSELNEKGKSASCAVRLHSDINKWNWK